MDGVCGLKAVDAGLFLKSFDLLLHGGKHGAVVGVPGRVVHVLVGHDMVLLDDFCFFLFPIGGFEDKAHVQIVDLAGALIGQGFAHGAQHHLCGRFA